MSDTNISQKIFFGSRNRQSINISGDKKGAKSTKKILILSANPIDTKRLRFDEEIREIEEGILRAKHRDQFEIKSKLAVRFQDLRRALLDYKPQIVHFIGHGDKEGLKVEDKQGNAVYS